MTANTLTFGYCLEGTALISTQLIKEVCRREKLPSPQKIGTLVDAVVAALRAVRNGDLACVVGSLSHMQPPDDISPDLWREGVICSLQTEGVTFIPVNADHAPVEDPAVMQQSQVIREYHVAVNRLWTEINNRLRAEVAQTLASKGKKYGRPPYGYHTVDGDLQIDRKKAEAVSMIIQRLRGNAMHPHEILDELNSKFATTTKMVKGKEVTVTQFWDYVKLRRIVSKARLYCLGEYTASDGTVITIPQLAFLPAQWADTQWPCRNHTNTPASEEQT